MDSFAAAGADRVTMLTATHSGEAIGVVRAALAAGIPVVISFTVETDGRLPSGQLLHEAIEEVDAATGGASDPANMAKTGDEQLRAAGLSRQKISYARSLSEEVLSGRLDFDNLPADDEEAIAHLTAVKGIGRWTAEIYLLFAEGRPDIWPAGDLAVQIEIGNIMGLPERPTEKAIRALAEAWRPHRGAAAVFAWHHRHQSDILAKG
ncbi:MAG TPA: DNA-3-methyladenine glycosylase 2 family protein [Allosphingosinicella sp.]|nr:DNA-3-methyladenine glycosylase 2 family protein [Allosphingosinicella sp.]